MADSSIDAALRPASHRVERECAVCGQFDDHPRHVIGEPDNSTTLRHMDCCRDAGCPDGSCGEVTKGAESKRGAALVKHLTKES